MKIFTTAVNRQNFKIRLTMEIDGFTIDRAPIEEETIININNGEKTSRTVVRDYDKSLSIKISYADVSARSDISDHSAFNLLDKGAKLFNFWAATLPSRLSGYDFAEQTGSNSTLTLIIPFKNSPVSDWVLGVQTRGSEYFELINGSVEDTVGSLTAVRDMFSPSVEIDQANAVVNPDGNVDLTFKVLNADGFQHNGNADVYFESTGGYLPLQRVTTTNGVGSVVINAKGLTTGQTFKVKAGFKYYIGKSQCEVTVQ